MRQCTFVHAAAYCHTRDGTQLSGVNSPNWQEIKQMQMQSTYWLETVLKMISLYVNALLCTLQHIVMQLSGVNSEN